MKCSRLVGGEGRGGWVSGWRGSQALLGGDWSISASRFNFRVVRGYHSPCPTPHLPGKKRKIQARCWFQPGLSHHRRFSRNSELGHRNHFQTDTCTLGPSLSKPFRFCDVSAWGSLQMTQLVDPRFRSRPSRSQKAADAED